jgi:hypothetical protein
MKIMIEVNGGVVCSIHSTQDCEIYLIDHDNIKEKGDSIDDIIEPLHPDSVVCDDMFNNYLIEALSEYAEPEVHDREEAGTTGTYNID